MRISPLFFTYLLFATTTHLLSMELVSNETNPSLLINLDKNISIIIVAYCNAKDELRRTCRYFRDFASKKNIDILKHDALQLNEKALNNFVLYYTALGNNAIVCNLLNKGADPNVHDNAHMSLMHYVARYGYTDIADMLLAHPALLKTALTQDDNSLFYLAMNYDQNAIVEKMLATCTIDGGRALYYAARNELLNVIHTLLACKIDINSLDRRGRHPLIFSALTLPIVKLLIINGAQVSYAMEMPQTDIKARALDAAIMMNAPNAVQLLLEHKADVNTKFFENNTPLHFAVGLKQLEIVKILLDYGASINARNNQGQMPVDVAATDEIKQLLIEHEKTPHSNRIKYCTLNPEATVKPDQKTLERLMIYHSALGDHAMVQYLLSQDVDPNICDDADMSAMHYAAQYGYLDIVDLLLEHPALITTHIADGEKSPFCLAMKHNQNMVITRITQTCTVNGGQALCYAIKKGLLNVTRTLLACKVDPNAVNDENFFPLLLATVEGDISLPIMQLLITSGAVINKQIKEHTEKSFVGATALHYAACVEHILAVQLLIDYGADVNLKTACDITPLHAAAEAGCLSIVEMLLSNDARVNEKNDDGWTPLHCAIKKPFIMQALLACPEINVNEKDNDGNTPLHKAAQYGFHLDILLKHPTVIVNAKNNDNKTPLDVALNKEVKKLLIKYGGKKQDELMKQTKKNNCVVQ